jgi:dihydroorotate dehydrogenase electron transfer subunit
MKEGAVIDVIGPLGNSYPFPSEAQFPVVVAGGIGIASVHSLVEKLAGRAYVIYGAKMGDELFMREDLERIAENLLLCTDDGSCGQKGTVIDVITGLRSRLREMREVIIYSCGPAAMVREVTRFAAEHSIRAYVSLEEHMACGIGACLGCVVKTKSGYKRVCREGPVFDAADIVWQEDLR